MDREEYFVACLRGPVLLAPFHYDCLTNPRSAIVYLTAHSASCGARGGRGLVWLGNTKANKENKSEQCGSGRGDRT